MKKKKILENGLIAAKGITAMIPVLGGTLTSVWSDIEAVQAKRKQERLEEFYIALKDEIELLKGQLKTTYISQPDFLDIFELTARYIVNERTEEKRTLFRNILLNSISSKDCTYDKTEKYLRLLEQLNYLEILILRILINPQEYNLSRGYIIKPSEQKKEIYPLVDDKFINRSSIIPNIDDSHFSIKHSPQWMLASLTNAPMSDVEDALYFLEQNRLIEENLAKYSSVPPQFTSHDPICGINNKLTKKAKDFLSFIMH